MEKQIKNYQILEYLTSGGYGTIYLVKDVNTNKEYIMKTESKQDSYSTILFEYYIFKEMNKNKVQSYVQAYDLVYDNKTLGLVMENAGVSLSSYIKKHGSLQQDEELYKTCFKQTLSGIQQLHKLGFIHKDLSPNNILIKDKKVNIIDFGLSKRYMREDMIRNFQGPIVSSFQGTRDFACIASHKLFVQYPSCDIESICYSFKYLWDGALPWKGIVYNELHDNYKLIQLSKQYYTSSEQIIYNELCYSVPKYVPFTLQLAMKKKYFTDSDYQSIFKLMD